MKLHEAVKGARVRINTRILYDADEFIEAGATGVITNVIVADDNRYHVALDNGLHIDITEPELDELELITGNGAG